MEEKVDRGMYEKFRDEAQAFLIKYENLKKLGSEVDRYPALKKEYKDLVGSGNNIYTSVKKVTGGVDSVVGWFNSFFSDDVKLNGLGFLPLIPIAIIIASVAAMGKWGRDVFLFQSRLAEIQRLEAKGVPPGQAARIVSEKAPLGVLAGVTREIMTPLTIAGVVLIAGYLYLKR